MKKMLRMLRFQSRLLWSAAAVVVACSSPIAPDAASNNVLSTPAGVYALLAINDRSLPIDYGSIPSFDADSVTASKCHLMLSTGRLTLNDTDSSFALKYSTTNSCDGSIVGTMTLDGSLVLSGQQATFRVPSAVPPDFIFTGTLSGPRITLSLPGETMLFSQ
jgi:hypothetical protein